MTEFVPLTEAQVLSGPPGNRLFLVCPAHPDTDDALMLGKRLNGPYTRAPSAAELNKWFEVHAECEGGPDKYRLAYFKVPNWDQVINGVLPPVTEAVKLALVKS